MDEASLRDSDVASVSTLRTLDDPPPAYDDLSRPVSILTDYSAITLTADDQPISTRPFPVGFNVYYKKTRWGVTNCYLGEHAEQPSNAVVLNSGWKGTTLTLHHNEDPESAILATATGESPWSRHSMITISAQPGSDEEELIEQLSFHTAFTSIRYAFSVRVSSPGEKPHIEAFEWRITHGAEVRDLDRRGWGWKLVRLHNPPGTARQGGKRKERSVGETSDGKEVVAVWAENSKASRNKLGKFLFVGSGATGELGRQWAVMAVVSGLRVVQNVSMGGSGGGGNKIEGAMKEAAWSAGSSWKGSGRETARDT